MSKKFKKVPVVGSKTKKVTKKTPAKKLSKKKTSFRKKKYDYSQLLLDIREERYSTIIDNICPLVSQEMRYTLGVSIVSSSKFRAYSIAMKEFLYMAKEFKVSKESTLLARYIDKLTSTDAIDHNLQKFNRIRINILMDYSTNAPGLFGDALRALHNDLLHPYDFNEGASSKKSLNDFITTLSVLVEQVWPGKGDALKVLYGS